MSHLTYGSLQPLDLLAIAPHPDDAEIGCGGTLAKAASAGKRTGILELTRGEMGSKGSPEIRDAEALEAAKVLGLAYRGNVSLPDGHLADTPEMRVVLAQAIRDVRPRVLLVPHPHDRHPDHVAAHALARSALHLAGLVKAPLQGKPHKVGRVWCYQGNSDIAANVLVDVSDHLEVWAAAIAAHVSQFTGEAVSETVSPEIVARRKARLAYWGAFGGVAHAEAFVVAEPMLGDPW